WRRCSSPSSSSSCWRWASTSPSRHWFKPPRSHSGSACTRSTGPRLTSACGDLASPRPLRPDPPAAPRRRSRERTPRHARSGLFPPAHPESRRPGSFSKKGNRHMRPSTKFLRLVAGLGTVALLLVGCGSTGSGNNNAAAATGGGNLPSWCGPNKATLGLTDGFGGNSWRLVTTASAKNEVAKCPNITDFEYADGQGNTQKAISDIQGMVAKGIKALVVFPDAGQAILPTLRSAHQAGVKVVPYRVFPGGTDGADYDVWVGADFTTDGKNWANWILKNLPNGGN